MPNLPVEVTRKAVVERAESQLGKGKYVLTAGGRRPRDPSPFDERGCDCTGFVAWCFGVDRYQHGKIEGDYIETSAMFEDADGLQRLFVRVQVHRPGDAIVYGDRYEVVKGRKKKIGEGHTGIVVKVDANGRATEVIDCASARTGGAVQRRPAKFFFDRGAIVVRFKGLVAEETPRRRATA